MGEDDSEVIPINITILEEVTIEQIKQRKQPMIFYGANTCWWSDDPNHLGQTPPRVLVINNREVQGGGLPCDPRQGMLMETRTPEEFLRLSEENPSYYGKHGIRAFMAAYHGVVVVLKGGGQRQPWCFTSWDEYNELLDRIDAAKPKPKPKPKRRSWKR